MTQLLIGCDPELAIIQNGSPISVTGMLGGTKERPLKVRDGAVQEDNVWAEINIDPASNLDEWVGRIDSVLAQLQERVAPHSIDFLSSHEFDPEYLRTLGPTVAEFGCDPDYSIHTGGMNAPPVPVGGLRTAGGHIHIGSLDKEIAPVIFAMDMELGLPSVLLDRDTKRRSMYGKAGCYREKPYGVEYRTLSNFWLRSKSLKEWAFNASVSAFNNTEKWIEQAIESRYEVQQAIDNSDIALATTLINRYGVTMP